MGSIKDMFRTVFHRKATPDVEQVKDRNQNGAFDQSSLQPAVAPVDVHGRPELDPTDKLNLFRHLTGITSHPSMTLSDGFFTTGGRPAPNLGIYARVVRNEYRAKVGFKYFSWLINGCLGLQIVVAASLTALGAAGGSRGAVTVFGAINTVIAGILTFLKGSGMPNRFKYYQTEWKRIREFIEQRERDFSRPDCAMDVHGVVDKVEKMYDEVKADLEASQQDRFAGNSTRKSTLHGEQPAPIYAYPTMTIPGMNALNEKAQEVQTGFGSRIKNLTSEITHYAHEARDVVKEMEAKKERVREGANKELEEYVEKRDRLEHTIENKVNDLAEDIGEKAHEVEQIARDAEARQREAVDKAVQEARENLARAEAAARAELARPITISMAQTGDTSFQQHDKNFKKDY